MDTVEPGPNALFPRIIPVAFTFLLLLAVLSPSVTETCLRSQVQVFHERSAPPNPRHGEQILQTAVGMFTWTWAQTSACRSESFLSPSSIRTAEGSASLCMTDYSELSRSVANRRAHLASRSTLYTQRAFPRLKQPTCGAAGKRDSLHRQVSGLISPRATFVAPMTQTTSPRLGGATDLRSNWCKQYSRTVC